MGRAMEAFFASLDEVTLADLAAPRIALRQRLGIGDGSDCGLAATA
jgi:DNA-binding IscR family transcriptional regulator